MAHKPCGRNGYAGIRTAIARSLQAEQMPQRVLHRPEILVQVSRILQAQVMYIALQFQDGQESWMDTAANEKGSFVGIF